MTNKRVYVRRSFEEWYADAKEYYTQHGDLRIDRKYVTDQNFRLGRWIERQRAIYNGTVSGTMPEHRIIQLNAIGMVWKLKKRYPRDVWLSKAREYFNTYGNLAVPSDYVADGFALGNWISENRKKYAKGLLTEQQIAELEACGMIWSLGTRRPFSAWYKDALDYYFANGNLLVAANFVTRDGNRLGQWISLQRAKYANHPHPTPQHQKEIALLNQLDMIWDIHKVRDQKWYETYNCVFAYKKQYGKLPLWPVALRASNGILMPRWITYQKQQLQNGKLSEEKIKKLSEIGIQTAV